jgi:hypothetical protein
MSYMDEFRRVASASREEIENDANLVREGLHRSRSETADLERRLASLETLLQISEDEPSATQARLTMTLHDAMAHVLRDAPGQRLRAGELAAEINRRRLYRMRDGRPVEAQQIHARVGHYDKLFLRARTFIKLASDSQPD